LTAAEQEVDLRKPIIAGNWKMNLLPVQGASLVTDIWNDIQGYDEVDAVVCPPFVDIPEVSRVIHSASMTIGLGAQNMHWEDSGAFTGEVSPEMLLDLGVSYVIIGHSERRQLFGETDQGVNRKVASAIDHGLIPIMCCGETLKQREAGQTEDIVTSQVKCGLFEIDRDRAAKVIIAYEPIWAIGTGVAATSADADEVCGIIRRTIGELYDPQSADAKRIQYGGSVSPKNVDELMSMPNVDGALVGGASLKPADFARLVRFT
jgi:triosephosphate isomerase